MTVLSLYSVSEWLDLLVCDQAGERRTLPITVPMRAAGQSKRYSTIAPAAGLLLTPACKSKGRSLDGTLTCASKIKQTAGALPQKKGKLIDA